MPNLSSLAFTLIVVFFIVVTLATRFWLGHRHVRHILRHRQAVPTQFAQQMTLDAHQKAADYTIAKVRFNRWSYLASAALLLGFTFFGGLQAVSDALLVWLRPGIAQQIALIAVFAVVLGLVDLPLDYYQQFALEAKFGFNTMTPALFFADLFKQIVLGVLLGLPLLWIVLTLMERAGHLWWCYAWLIWCGFQAAMLVLYPTLIAPLFNKFISLEDGSLRTRIEALLQRTGFASKGLFVMDGSKRSTHGNAYFSGFGAAKRIVFFDTLINRLQPPEIEAVLAHELGHFKLHHIIKRMAVLFSTSLAMLALLGYLKTQAWFFAGLGIDPASGATNATALLLFVLVLPLFTFFLSPLVSFFSRQHEYEADAFAAQHTQAADLISALVKLYQDNASTLTPDPLYSAFYDSHPPASLRVGRLLTLVTRPA